MGRRLGTWPIAAVLLAAAACSGADDVADGRADVAEATDDPSAATVAATIAAELPLADDPGASPAVTGLSEDLAPSQISASTVVEPPTPEPCVADDLEFWTAQLRPAPDGSSAVDAVVRIRNVSDEWCEVDIGRSPSLDPAVEPDVWLDPGATADLVVGQRNADGSCIAPAIVTLIEIAIGDEQVVVPGSLLTCGWWLTAFYPNDQATEPCGAGDVEVAVTASTVLVRALRSCLLGALTSVTGEELSTEPSPGPSIGEMLPGDVVAFGVAGSCAGEPRTIELVGPVADAPLIVEGVPCQVVLSPGGARPWFGASGGPLAAVDSAALDVDAALRSLDPFTDE